MKTRMEGIKPAAHIYSIQTADPVLGIDEYV